MKAYSVDLRQKVIDAYNQKQGSQRQLAKRFRVSLSFVQNLLKRYRIDGTVEPREHGGSLLGQLLMERAFFEGGDRIRGRILHAIAFLSNFLKFLAFVSSNLNFCYRFGNIGRNCLF